jgi:hypothetical protein
MIDSPEYWNNPQVSAEENLHVAQQIVNRYFRTINANATKHPTGTRGNFADDVVSNVPIEGYVRQLELILRAQTLLSEVLSVINKQDTHTKE